MHKRYFLPLFVLGMFVFSSCSSAKSESGGQNPQAVEEQNSKPANLDEYHKAYFASGCFWCVEAIYESVEGVAEVYSGYSGGTEPNPTYRQVGSGMTDHAEAVEVYYDSSKVDFPTLVKVFFGSHDPTTLNRQGPDRGPQYRSVAFYQNAKEKEIIEKQIAELTTDQVFDAPIVTQVVRFDKFWMAEEYHQDFEKLNPNQGYVKAVSIPRLKRFQAKFPEILKKDSKH